MTESLNDLLRRGASAVTAPRLDVRHLVAEADRRRRRRRSGVIAATAAGVGAFAVASLLLVQGGSPKDGTAPIGSPSPSVSNTVDSTGRPLAYAVGRTIHLGDRTFIAEKPVAFIAPTDDGAVYEAAMDGTLWFTDGTTTRVIGVSGYTAAPTAHHAVVSTGNAGSLVVWADVADPNRTPVELVVYDTARLQEVGRIPFPVRGTDALVDYVGQEEVWYAANDGRTDSTIYRFDVRTRKTAAHPRSDLDAALANQARTFTASTRNGRVLHGAPTFTERGGRLVARIHIDGGPDATPVTLADGSEFRPRLPAGYDPLWPADEDPALSVAQWLDDDRVVLWADDGGGDLPAKHGDFLVCRLPDGVCQVTVAHAARRYVAPYLSGSYR